MTKVLIGDDGAALFSSWKRGKDTNTRYPVFENEYGWVLYCKNSLRSFWVLVHPEGDRFRENDSLPQEDWEGALKWAEEVIKGYREGRESEKGDTLTALDAARWLRGMTASDMHEYPVPSVMRRVCFNCMMKIAGVLEKMDTEIKEERLTKSEVMRKKR